MLNKFTKAMVNHGDTHKTSKESSEGFPVNEKLTFAKYEIFGVIIKHSTWTIGTCGLKVVSSLRVRKI